MESTSEGGTEEDEVPTELDPREDYADVRGIVYQHPGPPFTNDEDVRTERDASGNLTFRDKANTTPIKLSDLGGSSVPAHHATHESGGSDAIKLDDLAAPDDTTDLNVSTAKHGLTPKAPNDANKYLDGTGAWSSLPAPSVFGTQAGNAASEGESSTTSQNWQDKVALTLTDVPAGTYRIGWYCEMRNSTTTIPNKAQVLLDDATLVCDFLWKLGDNTSARYWTWCGCKHVTLTAGAHHIDLQWCQGGGSGTAYIKSARLEAWRVA